MLFVLRFLKCFCILFGLRFKFFFCMLFVLRFLECFCMLFAECLCGINRCLFAFITFFNFPSLMLCGVFSNYLYMVLMSTSSKISSFVHIVFIFPFKSYCFVLWMLQWPLFYNNEYKIHDKLKRKKKEERGIIEFALRIEMVGSCCRKGRQ